MIKKITILLFMFLEAMNLRAQSDSLFISSIQEIYRLNSWLTGSNPVGIAFNDFSSFSTAEAGYSYHKGNFGNLSIPESGSLYKVYSESFQTFGKTSLYGKLGYRNEQKKNISWQGMTGNYWQGVNLCDSISGKQRSEQYQLSGAFSLPLSRGWLIATQFDYLVELTAKDTDPRNKNQWMEWILTPGIGYRQEHLRLGASLHYSSRKETVDYQNVGAYSTYTSLIAYPLAFYKTLLLGQKISWNYSSQEIGGALQAEIIQGPYSLFQEIAGSSTQQDIISNRIQDKKEGETDCWQIGYKGKLSRTSARSRHEWDWRISLDRAKSYEPLQQQEGTNVWQTYGKVDRAGQRTSDYLLSYGYHRLRNKWQSIHSFFIGIDYHQEKNSLLFYPAEYTQPIHIFMLQSAFTKSFLLPNGLLEGTIGGNFRKGGGRIMEEKELPPNQSAPEIALWQNQERLHQEFDYKTTPRWNIHLSITYTHTSPFRWFSSVTGGYEESYKNITNKNFKYFSAQIGILF